MDKEEVFNLIKKANEISSNGNDEKALELYLTLEGERYYQDELKRFIAGCHFDMEQWEKSFIRFKELRNLIPEDEHASLSIYVCLVNLGNTKQAISELNRFASKYPIDLYEDTIKELLIGLNNGCGEDFRNDIELLANQHNITIPNGCSKMSDIFPPSKADGE